MTMCTIVAAVVALHISGQALAVEGLTPSNRRRPTVRMIDRTEIVGDSDPALWQGVLDLLPARPARIELLNLNALPTAARERVRRFDAFVVAGRQTIFVIQQGATLRQAAFGDSVDRVALASLVWHELAHLAGADEPAAFEQEQMLWRRAIASGTVASGDGMAYLARLRELSVQARRSSAARDYVVQD